MAAFIVYIDRTDIPPPLVTVTESNGKYVFSCIFNLLNFMT